MVKKPLLVSAVLIAVGLIAFTSFRTITHYNAYVPVFSEINITNIERITHLLEINSIAYKETSTSLGYADLSIKRFDMDKYFSLTLSPEFLSLFSE